jgi:hypothetical protein
MRRRCMGRWGRSRHRRPAAEGTTRASGGEAGAAAMRLGQRRGERREIGENKEKERGEERGVLTSGPHCHLASTSAKPATKTIRWSKTNGFKS